MIAERKAHRLRRNRRSRIEIMKVCPKCEKACRPEADRCWNCDHKLAPERRSSPLALLREVLEKDRAAIAAMKKEAPWYDPDAEIIDLHRRIESCLSAELSSGGTAKK